MKQDLHLDQTLQVHCFTCLIWNRVNRNIPQGIVIPFYWLRVHQKRHTIQCPEWSENPCGRISRTKRWAYHLQKWMLLCLAPGSTSAPGGQMSIFHLKAITEDPVEGFMQHILSNPRVPGWPVNMHFVAGEGKELHCWSCQGDNGSSNFWACLRKV